jgi:D-fructose 1,6-bisphosphatase (EC 3.1.3.11)
MAKPEDLAGYLANNPDIPQDLGDVVKAICEVGITLSRKIARGALEGAMGAAVGGNADGDVQKALDIIADEMFFAALAGTAVRWYASEERENVVALTPGRERTADEFGALFEAAGLRLLRVIPTSSRVSLVEGERGEIAEKGGW